MDDCFFTRLLSGTHGNIKQKERTQMEYKPKFNATAFLAGYLRKSQAPNGMLVGYLQGPTKTK